MTGIHQVIAASGGVAKGLFSMIQEAGLSTNCVLALDAGDISSYAGSGAQQWTDLSGSGHHYNRGSTSGVDATDPTLAGTAGALDETNYWSTFAGSPPFSIVSGPTTFDDAWAQSGGKFTIACVLYLSSAGFRGICGNTTGANPAGNGGLMVSTIGAGNASLRLTTATFASANIITSSANFTTNVVQFAAVSFDQGAGTCVLQLNSTQESTSGLTGNDSGAPPQNFQIANTGAGANQFSASDRMYAFAAWSGTALSTSQLTSLYNKLKANRFTSLP